MNYYLKRLRYTFVVVVFDDPVQLAAPSSIPFPSQSQFLHSDELRRGWHHCHCHSRNFFFNFSDIVWSCDHGLCIMSDNEKTIP